jgi:hypothetical protein
MARSGVGSGLIKGATNLIAQVPGGENLVLQAVRDLLNELKRLRRDNDKLTREVARLNERLQKQTGSPAPTRGRPSLAPQTTGSRAKPTSTTKRASAGRSTPAAKRPSAKAAPTTSRGGARKASGGTRSRRGGVAGAVRSIAETLTS